MARNHRWLWLSLLLCWSLSHAWVLGGDGKDEPKAESAAEKTRKILDQSMVLDYTGQSLFDAIEHLKEKTRLNFVIDQLTLQQFGLFVDPANPNPNLIQVHLKADRKTKLRTALQRMLSSHNLGYAILEDSVLISTDDIALHRQLRQRVNVNCKDVTLAKALNELAQSMALNMVIDPRLMKDAQTPVTLQVEDATLETAVRLLAEIGGMKAVRMGNVLFVTSEARAEKIRREEQQAPSAPNPLNPGMMFDRVMGAGPAIGNAVPPAVPPPPPDKADKEAPPMAR